MSARSRGLLDTSVLVATETRRPLDIDALPDELFISVVTIAELQAGVLAVDTATRARRLATLDSVGGWKRCPSTSLPRPLGHFQGSPGRGRSPDQPERLVDCITKDKYIKDLTLAEIKTMDCGFQQLSGFPQQEQIKGFRLVELKDVLNLVKSYHATQVKLNIETKVEADAPEQTAPMPLFVRRVFEELHASGIERQVTIQFFAWGALNEMHRLAPEWPLVAFQL